MKKLLISLAAAATLFGGFAMADNYKIDNAHTAALFSVTHLKTSNTRGRFNKISGTFSDGAISIEIDVSSLDTNDAKRDKHLRGPDFFNAKQFPKMTFKSTAWSGDSLKGKLTIHGVTKSVTVTTKKIGEGKDPWGGFRRGYDVNFTIKRSDFGMSHMLGAVSDEVKISFSIEGIKQKG